MLYTAWMVIVNGRDIKKITFGNFVFSPVQGEKLHKQVVYQSLGSPPPPNPTQYNCRWVLLFDSAPILQQIIWE